MMLLTPSLQTLRKYEGQLSPAFDLARKYGAAVLWDGWTDVNGKPLQNVVLVCAGKTVFLKAFNDEGKYKGGEHQASQVHAALEEIKGRIGGLSNVLLCISDSAAACKLAGEKLEELLPNATWAPCVAHKLDLLMEVGSPRCKSVQI
jgi:hypothetical protein